MVRQLTNQIKSFYLLFSFSPFLLFSLSPPLLFSQEFSYKQYTVQDGLVQSQVVVLFQDSKGYIWAGTKGGLSRFDGKNFLNFNHSGGLPSNLIRAITEDVQGTVWILTSEGLASFDGEKLTGFPADIFRNYSIPLNLVSPAAGKIIIPVNNAKKQWEFLLFENGNYSNISDEFPPFNLEGKDENILMLIFDRRDTSIWLAAQTDGVFRKTKNGIDTIREGNFHLQLLNTGLDNENYLLMNDSLFRLEGNRLKFIFADFRVEGPMPVHYCKIGMNGTIFYAGYSHKLKIYDGKEMIDDNFSFTGIDVLYVDREENLWIGSESGLYKLLSRAFLNYIPGRCDINEMIWSIAEKNPGELLFMSYRLGAQSYNGKEFSTVNGYRHLFETGDMNFYMGAIRDHQGNILMPVTHLTAIKYDGNNFSRFLNIPYGPCGLFLYEDPDDYTIYAGTTDGILRQMKDGDTKVFSIQPGGGRSKNAVSILKDRLNRLWFGGFNGISLLDGDSVIHFPTEEMPFDLGGNCMLSDHRENIWIGNSDGVYFYNYDKFTKIPSTHLNSMTTSLCLAGDSILIIGSVTGLSLLDLRDYYQTGSVDLVHFGPDNGFQGTEVGQNAIFEDSKNYYWIACNDRVVRFDLAHYRKNHFPPLTYISGISLLNDDMEWVKMEGLKMPDQQTRFGHEQKNLRFEFTGVSTTYPEGVKYSHYLEGYDQGWSEPEFDNYAVYTNLFPGNYNLRLRSCNADGVWSVEPPSFSFRIVPAFYHRTSFWIIMLILAASCFVALGIFISNQRKKQSQLKLETEKKMAQLQLLNLKNQIDPHFTYNAINSIASVVLKEDKDQAYKFFVKFSNLIRGIMRSSEQLTRSLEEEITFVKDYLEIEKFRYKDKFDYLIFISPETDLRRMIPKMTIQTFAENALKHGLLHLEGKGMLRISVQREPGLTRIEVEDNGIGRDKAALLATASTGRGLSILRGYFDYFNLYHEEKSDFYIEDLKDENGEARGTRITVLIPDGMNYNA